MAFVCKVLSQGLCIAETLQCRVHEAGISKIAEPSCSLFCGFYGEVNEVALAINFYLVFTIFLFLPIYLHRDFFSFFTK